MSNEYTIIDNFLDCNDFLKIQNTFFPKNESHEKIIWNYNPGIVRNPELGPTGYEEHDWMYTHSFLISESKKTSEHINLIAPIIKKLHASEILDARANLLVPTKKHIHHESHIDRKSFHKVALLYITTNNGSTVLKNLAQIECVQNRMVIFDGSIYHHSVTSTDKVRSVININYIPYLENRKLGYFYK